MDAFDPLAIMGAAAVGGTAGFRIMLPLFLLSLAVAGVVPSGIDATVIPENLEWLGSGYAIAGFGAGYLAERFIYLIPVVDTAADSVEVLAAPLTGFSLSALMMDLGSGVPVAEAAGMASGLAAPAAGLLDGGFSQVLAGLLGGALALAFRIIMLLARLMANLVAAGPLVGVLEDLAALVLFFMRCCWPGSRWSAWRSWAACWSCGWCVGGTPGRLPPDGSGPAGLPGPRERRVRPGTDGLPPLGCVFLLHALSFSCLLGLAALLQDQRELPLGGLAGPQPDGLCALAPAHVRGASSRCGGTGCSSGADPARPRPPRAPRGSPRSGGT